MTTDTDATPAVAAALERARPIADAVLYEGYLLYPYRASATKNQLRWQFGVLMPPDHVAAGTGERDRLRAHCLLDAPRPGDRLHVRLRFLRLCHRQPQDLAGTGVDVLRAGDVEWTAWDEATEVELDTGFTVGKLLAGEQRFGFVLPAKSTAEQLTGPDGVPVGRLVRSSARLSGELRVRAEPLPGPYGTLRLRVEVANGWPDPVPGGRDAALAHALIACHAVLAGVRFLSLVDPPEWARPAAESCAQDGAWPVLLTEEAVLVSPIILDDHPEIAPESPANLFDGTEIDEILSLRTLALTDEEKREARATDPRARELIDHVDGLPAEIWDRLHGTVRSLRAITGEDAVPTFREPTATDAPWWDPGADTSVSPDTDHVLIDGVAVAKGSRVRLRPGRSRADAQDMFVTGRVAIVQAVLFDVDGARHLAVTIDGDPAADLEILQGRFRYFAPEEVEPLPAGDGGAP